MKLPHGFTTNEDYILIDRLTKDSLFLHSIESTDGKLNRVYADWKNDKLVYEFLNGSVKESKLSIALERIKKINYFLE